LLAKLAKDKLDDYALVKQYLLREFKLTPQQYRDRYLTAQNKRKHTPCTLVGCVITYSITGIRVMWFLLMM